MTVDNIEATSDEDDFSVSTESQVTDDPALKDPSHSQRSSAADSSSAASSEEASKFVKKESRYVLFLRMIVLLVLFAASAAISLVVYFVTSAGEQDTFESQYYAAANKVTGTCVVNTCSRQYSRSTVNGPELFRNSHSHLFSNSHSQRNCAPYDRCVCPYC